MIDVTVIVPTFNREIYLADALDSLLRQSVLPAQIIVIDDGSTDNTAKLITRYGDKVHYLKQPNAGKAAALNRALEHATGSAIWIFDDDDIAAPDALESLVSALEHKPEAGFAFGRHDVFYTGANGMDHHRSRPFPPRPADDLHFLLLNRCFCFQGAMLVRRRCYSEVGPFDESLSRAQDYDMMIRLSRRFCGAFVDRLMFHQRQHSGTRGPAHSQIESTALAEQQLHFDSLVLSKAYAESSLDSYLPTGLISTEVPWLLMRSHFRRAAVIGKRRLWEQAAADIEIATRMAADMGMDHLPDEAASVCSEIFQRANSETDVQTNPVVKVALEVAAPRLRRNLVAALSWPFFLDSLKCLYRLRWSAACQRAHTYLKLTGGRPLLRHAVKLCWWMAMFSLNRQRLLPAH